MANRKLTELPTLSPINFDSTDLLYIVDVQTDISKKIPFSLLAGDSLVSLSAYDTKNTLNVDYLSGSIDINIAAIATLEGGAGNLGTDIDFLSSRIDSNFNFLSTNIDTKFDQTSGNILRTDVDTLSGQVKNLDLDANESFVNAESLNQGTISLSTTQDPPGNDTVVNLGLLTTDSPQFAGLTVNGVNVPNQINTNTAAIALNTSYVSQVSVTPTVETPVQSHTVPITIGGVTYKILLAT